LDINPTLVKRPVESPLTIHIGGDARDLEGYRYKITLENATGTGLWQAIVDPHLAQPKERVAGYYANLILQKMHEDGILPPGCAGPIPE
jgi:hypothetical protein